MFREKKSGLYHADRRDERIKKPLFSDQFYDFLPPPPPKLILFTVIDKM
jgi:hypothetical protein